MPALELSYDVGDDATAPLAWGQQTTWDDIQFFLPEIKSFGVLGGWLPLDEVSTTIENVQLALVELVRRHPSLRSRYYNRADGSSAQTVLGRGVFTVLVEESGDEVLKSAQAAADHIFATGFDHDGGRPFRPVLITTGDTPRLLLFGVSHVATDLAGANQLSDELLELVQGHSAPRPAWTPVQLAEFEQSAPGQELDAAAQNHLRRQVETAPPRLLPIIREPEPDRFWRGQLTSTALPLLLRVLGRRYRTSTSTVLLALTTLIVNRLSGQEDCLIGLVQANRTAEPLTHCISSLSQTVQTTVSATGASTFAELIARTADAADLAQRHSRFDARRATETIRQVQHQRGLSIELTCRFNDTWSEMRRQLKRTSTDAREIGVATEHSRFDWLERTDSDKIALFVDVFGTDDELELRALADTARISPTGIERLLRSYEQLALQLLDGDRVLAELDY